MIDFRSKEYNRAGILNTESWPLWPLLPLKHRSKQDPELPGAPLTGILFAQDVREGRFVVRIGNIYWDSLLRGNAWSCLPKEEFTNIDDLLDAGWIGD